MHDEMPWQSSSGPQTATPIPALDPPAGASAAGVGPLDEVGVLEAGVPAAPDAPDVGAAGVLDGSVLPSDVLPEEDCSPPDSVDPEQAATRQAKTTKPARAGSKRAFMGKASGEGKGSDQPESKRSAARKRATKWRVWRADHGGRVARV